MRSSCPQPVTSPFSAQSGSCRGAWQIRHNKIEIRYHEPGLLLYGLVRLIHVVLIMMSELKEGKKTAICFLKNGNDVLKTLC